jgi:hypothetical protein
MEQRKTPWKSEPVLADDAKNMPLQIGPSLTLGLPDHWIIPFTRSIKRSTTGLASLTLDVRLIDGRYVVTQLEAHGPEGGQLDVEAVRRFPIAQMLRRTLPGMLERGAGTAEALVRLRREPDSPERVALVYRLAELFGDAPTSAVAADLHISQPAAAQRVRRARQAGLLPPARRGR